jgi:hypothetical protein
VTPDPSSAAAIDNSSQSLLCSSRPYNVDWSTEMNSGPSWPSAFVAVFLIALVGLMFHEAVTHDFATVWAGAGSIVGVVVGAFPSYFFAQQAQRAERRAQLAAGAADPDKFRELLESL